MIVADPTVVRLYALIERLAPVGIPVLITGETGSGKEFFAKALHQASQRSGKPFVAVNCAAIPETLIESELFGHLPGSFSGALTEAAAELSQKYREQTFPDKPFIAGEAHRQGTWNMPLITSITPNSAAAGSTFTLTIIGSNFQGVKEIEFHQAGSSHGGTGEGMMAGGFLAEVEILLRRGDLSPSTPSMRSVGYRQLRDHLEGWTSLPAAVAAGIAATRQLAKRQYTWIRSDPGWDLVDPFASQALEKWLDEAISRLSPRS